MSDDGMDLYRFFDNAGRLLYVGISISAISRAGRHRQEKGWWHDVARMDVEHHPGVSRAEIEAIERSAIQRERPLHNVLHAVGATWTPPPCMICGRVCKPDDFRSYVIVLVEPPSCDGQRCLALPVVAEVWGDQPCAARDHPCWQRRNIAALAALDELLDAGPGETWWVQHLDHDRFRTWPSSAHWLPLNEVIDRMAAR